MKQIIVGLLIGILFLSACGGPPPAANTPVMSNTADVPASTPTVVPTEVVIPIPKVVLSNNLSEATDETGVTPTSINDLDLSVVGTDQIARVSEITALAGDDARNMEVWIMDWLWANGLLDKEDGSGPKTYEEAIKVFDERYEFVGNTLESGPWSIAIKDKKTRRIGYAVSSNRVPIDASLMPIGATSLDDFDIVFLDMPEGGVEQYLTNNGSVFSIMVVDENRQPTLWLNTATGEEVNLYEGLPNEVRKQIREGNTLNEQGTVVRNAEGLILSMKLPSGVWKTFNNGNMEILYVKDNTLTKTPFYEEAGKLMEYIEKSKIQWNDPNVLTEEQQSRWFGDLSESALVTSPDFTKIDGGTSVCVMFRDGQVVIYKKILQYNSPEISDTKDNFFLLKLADYINKDGYVVTRVKWPNETLGEVAELRLVLGNEEQVLEQIEEWAKNWVEKKNGN